MLSIKESDADDVLPVIRASYNFLQDQFSDEKINKEIELIVEKNEVKQLDGVVREFAKAYIQPLQTEFKNNLLSKLEKAMWLLTNGSSSEDTDE